MHVTNNNFVQGSKTTKQLLRQPGTNSYTSLTHLHDVWFQSDNYGSYEYRQKKAGKEDLVDTKNNTRGQKFAALEREHLPNLDWFENPQLEAVSTMKVHMKERWVVNVYLFSPNTDS